MATVGKVFRFTVYSRRWGHDDSYRLTLNEDGWRVEFLMRTMPRSSNCAPDGKPSLFEYLRHDNISYPSNLGFWMEELWERATKRGLSDDDLQKTLDKLSAWVIQCEKLSPATIDELLE